MLTLPPLPENSKYEGSSEGRGDASIFGGSILRPASGFSYVFGIVVATCNLSLDEATNWGLVSTRFWTGQ